MPGGPEREAAASVGAMEWEPERPYEAHAAMARDVDYTVRRLREADRTGLTAFLDADPAFSIFPRGNLEHFSLNTTFVRYWGLFRSGKLSAALMMVGHRAALYAPVGMGMGPLAEVAVREGIEFTMGRADLVDEVMAHYASGDVERREEHHLAGLRTTKSPGFPRVDTPPGALIRRATTKDVPALTRLYLGSDGFEELNEEQVRRVMGNRVRSMRTYVAVAGAGMSLVAACSTSAETPHAAMIGGVWTAPEARNRGYSTAVVAALARELAEQGPRPYLFYLLENAPAARVYAKVGFAVVGRWSVAYLHV
ncbi:MAG: GNAT family N-acetyltransferase [Ktedonobacterales bacterium]